MAKHQATPMETISSTTLFKTTAGLNAYSTFLIWRLSRKQPTYWFWEVDTLVSYGSSLLFFDSSKYTPKEKTRRLVHLIGVFCIF